MSQNFPFKKAFLIFLTTASTMLGAPQSGLGQSDNDKDKKNKSEKPIDFYNSDEKDYVRIRANLEALGQLDYFDSISNKLGIKHVELHPRYYPNEVSTFNYKENEIGIGSKATLSVTERTLGYMEEMIHAEQFANLLNHTDSIENLSKQELFLFRLVAEADAKAKVAAILLKADPDNETVQQLIEFYDIMGRNKDAALYNKRKHSSDEDEGMRAGFLSFFDGSALTKQGYETLKEENETNITLTDKILGKGRYVDYVPDTEKLVRECPTGNGLGWGKLQEVVIASTGSYMEDLIGDAETPEAFIHTITPNDPIANKALLDAYDRLGNPTNTPVIEKQKNKKPKI